MRDCATVHPGFLSIGAGTAQMALCPSPFSRPFRINRRERQGNPVYDLASYKCGVGSVLSAPQPGIPFSMAVPSS
jgi:hypothetical protein